MSKGIFQQTSEELCPPKETIMTEKVYKFTATQIKMQTTFHLKIDHTIDIFHQELRQILRSKENTSEFLEICVHRSSCWKSNY